MNALKECQHVTVKRRTQNSKERRDGEFTLAVNRFFFANFSFTFSRSTLV
jgi:hypothetical protein